MAMKTRCIVNEGRAVRYDRDVYYGGAMLELDEVDRKALTASGDVSVADPNPASVSSPLSPELVAQAVDTFVQSVQAEATASSTSGPQSTDAGESTAAPSTESAAGEATASDAAADAEQAAAVPAVTTTTSRRRR